MRDAKHHGFTLVEMLVVIAIIAVLASLMLPALNSALGVARETKCRGNLRQQSLAVQSYAGDYALYIIPWRVSPVAYWPYLMQPYCPAEYNQRSDTPFTCPEPSPNTPAAYNTGGARYLYTSFGINRRIAANGPANVNWNKLQQIRKPAQVALITDQDSTASGLGFTDTTVVTPDLNGIGMHAFRHGGRIGVLYLDGASRYLSLEEVDGINADPVKKQAFSEGK